MQAALADLRIPRMEVNMGEDGDEPDLELDDDPQQAASLDTTRVPLIITVSQVYHCTVHHRTALLPFCLHVAR